MLKKINHFIYCFNYIDTLPYFSTKKNIAGLCDTNSKANSMLQWTHIVVARTQYRHKMRKFAFIWTIVVGNLKYTRNIIYYNLWNKSR